MFFLYQVKGGEEAWQEGLAELRDNIIKAKQPRYTTILDLDRLIDDSTTKEEMNAIKYRGPMYFDFDSDDIDDCITRVQKFIKKLEDLDVDLDTVSFYATGKKGFHCTIPQECFITKPNPKGVQGLPYIYKELAFSLYVDTMDIRVYSARKGRMFRTVNVERENGRFKVQVTAQEIKDMTEESYIELTTVARPLLPTTTPKLNEQLAVMYARAEQKVVAAQKRRGSAQKDVEALAKFKGEFPATIQKMMDGEGLTEGAGFNHIAMQLAITANGLGKTEDELVKLSAGLLAKHDSDGVRYNTPAKREAELRRMFDYTQDNVCYSYSVGAIKTLLNPETSTPDLDGITEAHGEVILAAEGDAEESLYGGVFITSKGVYRKTEEGIVQICDLAFENIGLLIDMADGSVSGFEADVRFRKEDKGRKSLGLELFTSRSKFLPFILTNMGLFTGSDNQVTAMVGRMRDAAIKSGGKVFLVHKEGIDLIKRSTPEGPVTDIIWVGADEVTIGEDFSTGEGVAKDVKYRFFSSLSTHGMYKSDLMLSPDFDNSERSGKALEALFNLNEPYVIGNLLGWLTASFHRQIYHQLYNQFPICQVFGQAGSGKSSTVQAMLHLYYYFVSPRITSAVSNTKFSDESNMQSSASIPCVLDEYKPRQFTEKRKSELLNLFRLSYNATQFSKGGGNDSLNSSWKDVQSYSYSAPLLFIGEAMETETAVLERCVSVPLSKAGLAGRGKNMQFLRDNRDVLSALGKELVHATFRLNLDEFRKSFDEISTELTAASFQSQNDRIIFNIAVVVNGLKFLKGTIGAIFGTRFDSTIERHIAEVKDSSSHVAIVVMSEAAKALNILAFMSNTEDSDSEFGLEAGVDYWQDASYLDLKMRNVFVKYVSWCRRKNYEILYDNEDAFSQGISGFAATIDRAAVSSPLKDSALTKVFRLRKAVLTSEGVEDFR